MPDDQRGTANRYGGVEPKQAASHAGAARNGLDVRAAPPRWPSPIKGPKYIDNAVTGVSYDWGGFLLHWAVGGKDYSTNVPSEWIIWNSDTNAVFNQSSTFKTRQEAIGALTPMILGGLGQVKGRSTIYVGFWANESFPFITPTLFSDQSTPRTMSMIRAKGEQIQAAAREAEDQMRGVAVGMIVGRALGGVARIAGNPRTYDLFGGRPAAPKAVVGSESGLGVGAQEKGLPIASTPPPEGTTTAANPASPGESLAAPVAKQSVQSSSVPEASPSRRSVTPESRSISSSENQKVGSSAGRGMRSGKAVGTNVPAQTALAYRTAAGEILGEIPANEMPATNTGPSGLGLEPRMRAILEERFPRSQFRYNSGPGGPDVDWVGGEDPGFDALDFKPDTVDQHYKARKQFREWGGEGWKGRVAPPTFRAAICAYMSDGTLYIRDIAVVGRDYLKGLW